MSEEKKDVNQKELITLDNFQKYVLGYKGNGVPRALYDILRDFSIVRKKKKKKHKNSDSIYSFYSDKKKKKKKKKNNKHWNFNDFLD
jgi:hypothetical protein